MEIMFSVILALIIIEPSNAPLHKTLPEPRIETVDVYKKGVLHRFVPSEGYADRFVKQLFPTWEEETFEIFEKVQDPDAIAIDLGAWIGTTAIWLSKHFAHVVAVEPDPESFKVLPRNLHLSGCRNVTLCRQLVTHRSKEVVFGPRTKALNESMSAIKAKKDHPDDSLIRSISFAEFIAPYASQKVGFIKCDIEGGEEEILEDLLQFAKEHGCKVYVSFHLDWWKTKKIADFAPLFALFKTNCPEREVEGYIRKNPFASLLFEPKEN